MSNEADVAEAAQAKVDRRSNVSPAPTQSKKEKKRLQLVERLQSLSEQFDINRDREYREMLSKIQLDTALVMQVDPYAAQPLAAIDKSQSMSDSINPQLRGATILEMAGPKFQEWVNTIEDLVERRDFELTRHKVRSPCAYTNFTQDTPLALTNRFAT